MLCRQGMPRIDILSLTQEDRTEMLRLASAIVTLSLRYDAENTDPDNAIIPEAMWTLCKLYEGSATDDLYGPHQVTLPTRA